MFWHWKILYILFIDNRTNLQGYDAVPFTTDTCCD